MTFSMLLSKIWTNTQKTTSRRLTLSIGWMHTRSHRSTQLAIATQYPRICTALSKTWCSAVSLSWGSMRNLRRCSLYRRPTSLDITSTRLVPSDPMGSIKIWWVSGIRPPHKISLSSKFPPKRVRWMPQNIIRCLLRDSPWWVNSLLAGFIWLAT